MPDPQQDPGIGLRRSAGADRQRVIELMREARRPLGGAGGSTAALLRRLRRLEHENEQLRHGPHGGPV